MTNISDSQQRDREILTSIVKEMENIGQKTPYGSTSPLLPQEAFSRR